MPHGRIIELDAVRGIAVISMVIGHVANYSFLWRTTHFVYYVWDGAQLFMLVSGIVVGIVQHRVLDRDGMRTVSLRLLRRAGLLYVLQVSLVALAVIAYFQFPSDYTAQFAPKFAKTLDSALIDNLTLGVNPIYVNFLSAYVIVLVLTIPAIWLLARGHWLVLTALVFVQYVLSQLWPGWFTLPFGPDAGATLSIGGWFLLFASGLMAGWFWREKRVGALLLRPEVRWVAFGLWGALVALATVDAIGPTLLAPVNALFAKEVLAPGRFLSGWVFFIILWWLAAAVMRQSWGERVVRPVAVLGSRSLDAVVILTLAAILIPTVLHVSSESRPAEALSIVVLGVCWAWAYARNTITGSRVR